MKYVKCMWKIFNATSLTCGAPIIVCRPTRTIKHGGGGYSKFTERHDKNLLRHLFILYCFIGNLDFSSRRLIIFNFEIVCWRSNSRSDTNVFRVHITGPLRTLRVIFSRQAQFAIWGTQAQGT